MQLAALVVAKKAAKVARRSTAAVVEKRSMVVTHTNHIRFLNSYSTCFDTLLKS
jgi:hypothetical protein